MRVDVYLDHEPQCAIKNEVSDQTQNDYVHIKDQGKSITYS